MYILTHKAISSSDAGRGVADDEDDADDNRDESDDGVGNVDDLVDAVMTFTRSTTETHVLLDLVEM